MPVPRERSPRRRGGLQGRRQGPQARRRARRPLPRISCPARRACWRAGHDRRRRLWRRQPAQRRGRARCGWASTMRRVTAPADLDGLDGLVLPGVGRFAPAAARLREAGLWEPLREWAPPGRPLLGICLGMQLLFDGSDEDPGRRGLGLIPGRRGQARRPARAAHRLGGRQPRGLPACRVARCDVARVSRVLRAFLRGDRRAIQPPSPTPLSPVPFAAAVGRRHRAAGCSSIPRRAGRRRRPARRARARACFGRGVRDATPRPPLAAQNRSPPAVQSPDPARGAGRIA